MNKTMQKNSQHNPIAHSRWRTLLLTATLLIGGQAYAAQSITFYHNDILGSPVATTDEFGNICWREDYQPYGEKLNNDDGYEPSTTGCGLDDNQRGYTGHVHDKDIGLTYMQARYYDPIVGRFMGIDPVGVRLEVQTSFNRYAYGGNNPYKFVDPDGREIDDDGDTFDQNEADERNSGGSYDYGSESGESQAERNWDEYNNGSEAAQNMGAFGLGEWAGFLTSYPGKFMGIGKNLIKNLPNVTKKLANPPVQQINPKNLLPTQTRNEMSGSQIKRLTKDMKKNGFDQTKPVDVARNPRGRLEIQDGHHRTEAAKKAGLDKIPVKIWGE